MKLFLVLFIFLATSLCYGDAVIFSGADVKALKFNLDLFGRSKVMGLNVDPSTGAGIAAPLGSLGMDYLTGHVYYKSGAGDTQWTSISGAVTGTTLTFAGYNAAGVLDDISQWTFTTQGRSQVDVSIAPADVGNTTFSIHRKNFTLAPSAPLTDDYFHETNVVTLNGSNAFSYIYGKDTEIYKNGAADADYIVGDNIQMNQNNTGTINQLTANYASIQAGDGTNASTTTNIRGSEKNIVLKDLNTSTQVFSDLTYISGEATAVIPSITGFGLYGTLAGPVTDYRVLDMSPVMSDDINTITGFSMNPQNDGDVTQYYGLSVNGYGAGTITNYTGVTTSSAINGLVTNFTALNAGRSNGPTTNYTGVNVNPGGTGTISSLNGLYAGANQAITNYTGLNLNGGTSGTSFIGANIYSQGAYTNYSGVSITPSSANSGYFQGLNVSPSGGGGTMTGLQVNGSGAYTGDVIGVSSNVDGFTSPNLKYTFQGNGGAFTSNSPISSSLVAIGPGTPNNSLGGTFTIDSGSPVTGTYGFGNNLGILIIADDDMDPDLFLGSESLGFSVNGFVNQVSVANTKTVDTVNYMMAGGSFPPSSSGGTITNLSMFRALGLINGGGTLNITNMIGFQAGSSLAFGGATNLWGFRSDSTSADNWFANNLVVGGTTMKPSNSSIGLEIQGTTKALKLSELTGTEKSALTALNGMMVYDSSLSKISFYQNGAWAEPGTGTVTSVALSLPSELTVSGSPVTSSGTLSATWASQSTGRVFAAPAASAGTPSFRSLVAGDIPSISSGLTGVLPLANGGSSAALTASAGAIVYSSSSAMDMSTVGTSGQLLTSGGTGAPTWTNQASGRWTPTISNTTNVSASTSGSCHYSRIGNTVTFACYAIAIDPTAAGGTTFQMSLPVSSNFTATADVGGTCKYLSGDTYCVVYADSTNDTIAISFNATGIVNDNVPFSGQYEVK